MFSQSAKQQINRSSRRRCLALITTGIILKTLLIIALIVAFVPIRSPKVWFRSVAVETLIANSTHSPTLRMKLRAELAVKNPNFGQFSFSDSSVAIFHRGSVVGVAAVPGARAAAKSSKQVNVAVTVRADGRILEKDLSRGRIRLSGRATLKGKIRVFKVVERKKEGMMNCTVDVDVRTQAVQGVECL